MSLASSQRSLASSDSSNAPSASVLRVKRRAGYQASSQNNILLFFVAFRILNALCVRTFFQPDEFFQSLEPAWQVAFGKDSGAWITWEWRHELRSSIHPLFFAAIYYLTGLIASVARLSPLTAADALIAAPKAAQAIIAATGDYYTWKLARKVYGDDSYGAWATLALTALSPWQWFCSTRTFSNCAETTLTVVALYLWPWDWFLDATEEDKEEVENEGELQNTNASLESASRLSRYRWPGLNGDILTIMFLTVALPSLRRYLLLAALACVLRPTNVLIWACLAGFAMYQTPKAVSLILVREAILCGSAVLGFSVLVDRVYYGVWAFPFFKFLWVNVAQSIAIFYGQNDWHYYLSQGFPLLLTTALPFGLLGIYRSLRATSRTFSALVRFQLASVSLFMPAVLSVIAHKEVRFIYPLLPALHVLSAEPFVLFFLPAISSSSSYYLPRRLTLIFLVLVNVFIANYTAIIHASGPADTLSYLRERHAAHNAATGALHAPTPLYGQDQPAHDTANNMTVGFLMPCHSTPWRSQLVFRSIDAWALSCEPPLGLSETEKKAYLDEADQFYENPAYFLQTHMTGGLWHTPRRPSYLSPAPSQAYHYQPSSSGEYTHEWPDYLVFFAQLEPIMRTALRSSSYGECWRTWNTAWHDDWRRKGDIVVWCLDPTEQHTWRRTRQQKYEQHRDKQFERIVSGFQREAAASTRKRTGLSGKSTKWGFSGLRDKLFSSSSSSSSTWLRSPSSLFNKERLPWPFAAKKQTFLPSWLTQWPWSSPRRQYPYLPRFLQNYMPGNRASSWFSFSWPWSKKKNSGYPRIPEFERERDLWS